MSRRRNMLWTILVASVALAGCAEAQTPRPSPMTTAPAQSATPAESGSAATWDLVDPGSVTAESRTLDVAVTRLGCANGETGELLAPVVTYEAGEVIIRIDAEVLELEAANCLGNNAVPVTVVLSEAVGERALVDGGCIGLEAEGTAPCMSSVRASFAP
ncbi:hypothetical protein [Microbacterium paraoxydans]|uniref:hypothetical protein n=1 Tax=Microbacterium paraoxydans TaxID=199592 RepID=UPI001CFB4525|nr:hypothetical protein [Microbacterium paraoxydans]